MSYTSQNHSESEAFCAERGMRLAKWDTAEKWNRVWFASFRRNIV